MDHRSLAERIMEAVKRDGEKPAIERWRALIARGAIDAKGRVLLKAPSPMRDERVEPSPKPKKSGKKPRRP